jgi:hypothetical protein
MDELSNTGDPRDPRVAQGRDVADRLHDDSRLVVPNRRKCVVFDWSSDNDGRQSEPDELVDTRIVFPQIGDEHAVDAAFTEPAAVDLDLVFDGLDQLNREGDRSGRKRRLDAGDELHEERLEREGLGRPRQHEAAGIRALHRQGARGSVRVPAELAGDREDPFPRAVGDSWPTVQGVRNGAFRDSSPRRDVADRDSACTPGWLGQSVLLPAETFAPRADRGADRRGSVVHHTYLTGSAHLFGAVEGMFRSATGDRMRTRPSSLVGATLDLDEPLCG